MTRKRVPVSPSAMQTYDRKSLSVQLALSLVGLAL